MDKTEYVRGSLTPANKKFVDGFSFVKIEHALESAGIKSFLSDKGNHIRGIVEFQGLHKSAGIGFVQDFGNRLRQFIGDREIAPFGFEGKILVISDYLKDEPEIYTVTVTKGNVTYRESHVLWEPDEKRP